MSDEQKLYAKRYRATFIEPGIISYEDLDAGTIFVPRGALDRMRNTFIGKPVVNEDHIDLEPEEAFRVDENSNPLAKGIVVASGTNGDGWDYVDFLVWDRETQKNIDERGYSVSCAYVPTKVDTNSGVWHNIPYDEALVDGVYTHLAIVTNPRYEGVQVYENSKGRELMKFKIFKNKCKPTPEEEKKKKKPNAVEPPPEEEMEEVDSEASVIEVNGEMIPLEEAIAAYQATKQNEVVPMSPEDTVEIDGEMVTVADLIKAVQAGKENVGDPEKVDAEAVVDEDLQKKNSKANEEKPNKHFTTLKKNAKTTELAKPNISTKAERIQKGKARYGTAVKPREVTV